MLLDLIKKNRSYRRFLQQPRPTEADLTQWLEAVRYTASGKNMQPIKYLLVSDEPRCQRLFPLLKWAAYLPDWDGPEPDERPTAYLVQLVDTRLSGVASFDQGLQLEAFTLMASEAGYGCCILLAFHKEKLSQLFALPDHLVANAVVAIGKPAEEVQIVPIVGGDVRYYRDSLDRHIVPKRSMEELLDLDK